MSNKVDEALYNTLESPQRYLSQRNVAADPVNDYDYTNVNECSYQKLNPASAVAKNMYSSLVTTGSDSSKTQITQQIPQDYLTPIKEHFKMSNTTAPVIAENKKESSNKGHGSYLCLLLLLTCVSLLTAIAALALAVVALSKADNTTGMASPRDEPTVMTVTQEARTGLNVTNSAAELDKKLLEFYINITTQLSTLMDSISNVGSTGNILHDEVELIKGSIISLNNATRRNHRTILTRTAEMAVLGFRVQDLTTELNKLKASQQTDAIMDNRTTKVPVISQVYIQWGKQSCSSEGTTPVYTGYAAGPGSFRPSNNGRQQDFAIYGGGTNMLCLTDTPSLRASHVAPSTAATVYAAQYLNDSITFAQPWPMPCSACEVHNSSSVITVPGSDRCPAGWTMEYNGFIMGQSSRVGRVNNFEESQYICVDDSFDSYSGASPLQQNRMDTATFMSAVKVDCGQGIRCGDSKYSSTLSLTCAVCSKRTLQ